MMPKALSLSIKIASTLFIIGFLSIELWNLYASLTNTTVIPVPIWILLWGRFALIAHFLEAIAASVSAYFQQKNFFTIGIYTFFVGTIGLWEVLADNPFKKIFRQSS